jgi:mono/diheme cytochrome c family protein
MNTTLRWIKVSTHLLDKTESERRCSMLRFLPICLIAASPALAEDPDAGAAIFQTHCATCHGSQAMGDGPLGGMLTIPPPDLTGLSARNDGVFPLARVLERIDGTTEVMAHGGPMPLFGLILEGPSEVVVAPDGSDIAAPEALIDIASWLMEVQQ